MFKKFLSAILLCIAIGGSVNAQTNDNPGTNTDPNAPDIKFEKLTHDYGTIVQGADGTCEFKFTNVGKSDLIISSCQGSCGCTVPKCPTEKIAPGQSGVIKVSYDTNRTGPIRKTVSVNSNAKNNLVTLNITGNVEPKPKEDEFPASTAPKKAAAFEKN